VWYFSFVFFTGDMWQYLLKPGSQGFFHLSWQQNMPVIHGTLLKFPTFDAVVPFSNTIYQLYMEFYHLLMVISP
jgi:hypothetical protein